MKKIIRIIGLIFIELVIVAGCILIGIRVGNSEDEKELLTINKIALVNLDDGVQVNEEYKYYGTEFIRELDDNFEITSLEQARQGLENDLYAAYIIIPTAFSKNIESINVDPIKSNISYKVNPNLDYIVREEVIIDIWTFNSNLSTNIEYVYVDAILRGVHTVQDGAELLLENDLEDLRAVLQFTETNLVVDPEFPDEKHVDHDIAMLDLSEIFASMQTVFRDLSTEYKSSQASAQLEYDKLVSDMTNISTKMGNLNSKIGEVADIDEGEEFSIENDEAIDSYVSEYNTNLTEWKENYDEQVVYNFDEYMNECQQYANNQFTDLNTNHKQKLKNYYDTAYKECDIITQSDLEIDIGSLVIYDTCLGIVSELKSEIIKLNDEIVDLKNKIIELQDLIEDLGGFDSSGSVDIATEGTSQDLLDKDYEAELFDALEIDIPYIKEIGQTERNIDLRKAITNWLVDDLVYHGVQKDMIGELDYEEMNGEKAIAIIEAYYETDAEFPIEPVDQNGESEDPEEESSSEEDVNENLGTGEDSATDSSEEIPEDNEDSTDNESQDSNDGEKTEQEILLEKRAGIIFANTYDLSLVDTTVIDSLIASVVISPISASIMQEYSELTTSYTELDSVLSIWNTKLKNFKINSYGDEEKRNTIEKLFNENMGMIQTKVNEKFTDYETYVTQAEEYNRSNLEAWRTSIEKANEDTRSNIDNNIKNIKYNREENNINNNELMNNILSILPYTRVGELENRTIYKYISSPIMYENLSEQIKIDDEESEHNDNIMQDIQWEKIVVLVGVVLCIICGFILIKQVKKRSKYLKNQDLI